MATPVSVMAPQPKTIPSLGAPLIPQSVPFTLDFTGEATYLYDATIVQSQNVFGIAKSIYIDNGNNPNSLTLTIGQTNISLTAPAYSIGYYSISAPENARFQFYSIGGVAAGQSAVGIEIYNYQVAPCVWYTVDPLSPGFQVEALYPTANTYNERNTVLAAGVAADVFPAVASARAVAFRNIGDAASADDQAFFRLNATADAVFANSFILPVSPNWLVLPYRTAQRISMYSVGGTNIEAYEWNP